MSCACQLAKLSLTVYHPETRKVPASSISINVLEAKVYYQQLIFMESLNAESKLGPLSRLFRSRAKRPSRSELNLNTTSASMVVSQSNDSTETPPPHQTPGSSSANGEAEDVKVKDLWFNALQRLSNEEKAIILQSRSVSKLNVLQDICAAVERKRNDCENRRWKFELNGRQIILRDLTEKIIVWIDKFKEIGDIAVNFDPVHAALPWAGVRFLLQVGVKDPLYLIG